MQRSRFAFIAFAAALCLGACGTKGPLYIPAPPNAASAPAPTNSADDSSRAAPSNPK